jgi:hypothetical protein
MGSAHEGEPKQSTLRSEMNQVVTPVVAVAVAQLVNVARRVGLRRLVKDGVLSPAEALVWLRKNDPSPNPSIVGWLERKVAGGWKAAPRKESA